MLPLQFILRVIVLLLVLTTPSFAQSPIKSAQPMPAGRGFHGLAIVGDFIYLIGGQANNPQNTIEEYPAASVWVGKISPDGNVLQWGQTSPIPGPRYYISNSTVVQGDTIYVFGGSTEPIDGQSLNTVIWNRPNESGGLGPWRVSEPFGDGLSSPAAVATPGHIHIIGGQQSDDRISNKVWTNQLGAEGSMSRWEEAPSLPRPIWFHQSGVVAGRVYVWGGLSNADHENPQPSRSVYSAPVLGTGKLGSWRTESNQLPTGFYSASSAVAGPYLISYCPRYEQRRLSNDVWWTYIGPNGMDTWRKLPTQLIQKVYHAAAPDYRRGSIYLAGGRGPTASDDLRPEVSYFKLSREAQEAAESSWVKSEADHQNSVSANAANSLPGSTSPQVTPGGFIPLQQARDVSKSTNKPLVMYFNLPNAAPCIEQMELLNEEQVVQISNRSALAWIDTSQNPQTAQALGIYRVPTWVFFDASGEETARRIGTVPYEEINGLIP